MYSIYCRFGHTSSNHYHSSRSDELFILCVDQNHDKSNSKYLQSCFYNDFMYSNCKLQIYTDSTWAFMALNQQNRNPLTWRGCKIMPREVAECNALVLNLKIDPCKKLHHHHVQVLYRMLCVCVLGIRCPRLLTPKCLNYHFYQEFQDQQPTVITLRILGSTTTEKQWNLLNWGCALDCFCWKTTNNTHVNLLVTVWNLPCPCHPPASAIAISMAAPVNRAQMSSNSCMIKMGSWYASWWFQSIWNICSSNWIISPGRGENKKTSETTN